MLEKEGGAQVAGGEGEQADERDEGHGSTPPGLRIGLIAEILLDIDQIIPPWEQVVMAWTRALEGKTPRSMMSGRRRSREE